MSKVKKVLSLGLEVGKRVAIKKLKDVTGITLISNLCTGAARLVVGDVGGAVADVVSGVASLNPATSIASTVLSAARGVKEVCGILKSWNKKFN